MTIDMPLFPRLRAALHYALCSSAHRHTVFFVGCGAEIKIALGMRGGNEGPRV